MPIKLNWTKGKNLGLAMIFLGIMGLFQVLFIALAQYKLRVGSLYVVSLIPIAIIIATFYSLIIIFESNTSMASYRSKHKYGKKSKFSLVKSPFFRPLLIVMISFTILFFITLGILKDMEDVTLKFILSENVAAIGSLFIANYFENAQKRATAR